MKKFFFTRILCLEIITLLCIFSSLSYLPNFCLAGSEQGQERVFPSIDLAPVQIKRNYFEVSYPMAKGLNLKSPSSLIDNQEALSLINFLWDKNGALSLRKGYTLYNTSAISSKPFGGGYRYYKSDGSKYLVIADSTRLWVGNDSTGNFTANTQRAFTSGVAWNFGTWQNFLIGTSDNNATINHLPITFDGTNILTLGIADSGYCTAIVEVDTHTYDYLIDENKDWEIDHWVGYYVLIEGTITDTILDGDKLHYIVSNSSDSLKIRTGICWSTITGGYPYSYKIISILDNTPILATYLPTQVIIAGCTYNTNKATVILDTAYNHSYSLFSKSFTDSGYFIDVSQQSSDTGGVTCYANQGIEPNYLYLIKKKRCGGTKCSLDVQCSSLGSDPQPCSFINSTVKCHRIWRNEFLPFEFQKVHKNRLYLAGNYDNPNRIYYSELNNVGDFPAINYFDLNPQEGENITGLATFYTSAYASPNADLYIFKSTHIYQLSGNSILDFALYEVASNIGCIAPKSIVSDKGTIYFLAEDGIYTFFQNYQIKKISDKIDPIIKGMNKTKIEKASAIFYDNHYWLSYPDSSDTVNSKVLVYSPQFDAWGQVSFNAGAPEIWIQQSGISDTIKMLFGKGGKIYRYGTALKDESSSITGTYQTKWFNLDDPLNLKRLSYFDVDYSKDTGLVHIGYYKDYGSSLTSQDTLQTNENTNRNTRFTLSENLWGEKFSMKITSSGVGTFTIPRFGLEFKVIGKKVTK